MFCMLGGTIVDSSLCDGLMPLLVDDGEQFFFDGGIAVSDVYQCVNECSDAEVTINR
jgi:hypothetical protein